MKVLCLWCGRVIEIYLHIRYTEEVFHSICSECLNSQNLGYKEVSNEETEKEKEE